MSIWRKSKEVYRKSHNKICRLPAMLNEPMIPKAHKINLKTIQELITLDDKSLIAYFSSKKILTEEDALTVSLQKWHCIKKGRTPSHEDGTTLGESWDTCGLCLHTFFANYEKQNRNPRGIINCSICVIGRDHPLDPQLPCFKEWREWKECKTSENVDKIIKRLDDKFSELTGNEFDINNTGFNFEKKEWTVITRVEIIREVENNVFYIPTDNGIYVPQTSTTFRENDEVIVTFKNYELDGRRIRNNIVKVIRKETEFTETWTLISINKFFGKNHEYLSPEKFSKKYQYLFR